MSEFEILCVTMGQKDFSKIKEMNIQSDIIMANQTDSVGEEIIKFDGHHCKMISTTMRGVGNNRNTALMYAEGEICLMADDDMRYCDDYAIRIQEEFKNHPEADVIIFNIKTSTPEYGRIPTQIKKFKKFHVWSRNPYGAPRIAFRLNKVKKKNICFSTYFGGGCIFKSGEDTIWLEQLRKAGLKIYMSPVYIGDVSYQCTTSFTEDIREKLYTKGAMFEAEKSILMYPKLMYDIFFRKNKDISIYEKYKLINAGRLGYRNLVSYNQYEAAIQRR